MNNDENKSKSELLDSEKKNPDDFDTVIELINTPKDSKNEENGNNNLKCVTIEVDADKVSQDENPENGEKSKNIDINIDEEFSKTKQINLESKEQLAKKTEKTDQKLAENFDKKWNTRYKTKAKKSNLSSVDQFDNIKAMISEEKEKSKFIKKNIFKKLDDNEDIDSIDSIDNTDSTTSADNAGNTSNTDSTDKAANETKERDDSSQKIENTGQNNEINEINKTNEENAKNVKNETNTTSEEVKEDKSDKENSINEEDKLEKEVKEEKENTEADKNTKNIENERDNQANISEENKSDDDNPDKNEKKSTDDKSLEPEFKSDSEIERDNFIKELKTNAKIYNKSSLKTMEVPSSSFKKILNAEFIDPQKDNKNSDNNKQQRDIKYDKLNNDQDKSPFKFMSNLFIRLKNIREKEVNFTEYSSEELKETIKIKLLSDRRKYLLQTLLLLVLTVCSSLSAFIFELGSEIFSQNSLIYPAVNLLTVFLAIVISRKSLILALSSVCTHKINSDISAIFLCMVSILQLLFAIFEPNKFSINGLPVYVPLLVFGFFVNSWGKLSKAKRIYSNFICLSKDNRELYSVKLCQSGAIANEMRKSVGRYNHSIAYQQKTKFTDNFMKLSYETNKYDIKSKNMAIFTMILSIVLGAIIGTIKHDILVAVTVMSLFSALSYPMSSILFINKPLESLCKKANKCGNIISSYSSVEKFANTSVVALSAKELYSKDSVHLYGIKGFAAYAVDRAILDAAAIIISSESPLAPVFEELAKDNLKTLPAVEKMTYYDNLGISAWVKGRKVLVGNRIMMENHGISPLSRDEEQDLVKSSNQLTYIAVSNELLAVMVTEYYPKLKLIKSIQNLEDNGISLLIATEDANISVKNIAKQFKIFLKSIKILPSVIAEDFIAGKNRILDKADASLVTTGKTPSFANLITSCVRFKSNIVATSIAQIASIILSMAIITLLVFSFDLEKFSTIKMLSYAMFWFVSVLIVPYIRKS